MSYHGSNFFRGYVYVHLTGYATERFLNLCGSRNILIWNLKPTEDGYYFYISVDGYRKFKANLKKNKRQKVVAYLLGENIKVYPDVKMIVIKIDSTSQGNLARGMVGQRLLQEIEDELLSINHLEDYTLITMMISSFNLRLRKDDFLKNKME